MVGGSRKDDSVVFNSTNVFAALDTLRKKKKSTAFEKEKQGSSKTSSKHKDADKEVFWAPAPLTVKSWADVDDDDDDDEDYYATTAPSVSAWGAPAGTHLEKEVLEVSESEEEGLDEVDDDVEEEHENEHEPEAPIVVEPFIKKPPEASSRHRESERQLSKKELKKKGLAELDAVLAELGYSKQETGVQDDSHSAVQSVKTESNVETEKENAPAESKSLKKKKKKEKVLKEAKESEDQPHGADVENEIHETTETEKSDDVSAVDVKAHFKKVVSTKKKKSSKETDAAARAAASEAAARSARLAAAKKKEKNHYNQQPAR